jgi:hypothetical protein
VYNSTIQSCCYVKWHSLRLLRYNSNEMIFLDRNDPQAMAIQKEREERVRRIREQQEEERKKKLEELRHHVSQVSVSLLNVEEKGETRMLTKSFGYFV